jgi:fibro-slime domain-containing protein
MYGGNGNDEINGNEGNDSIYGEADEDKLYGNEGNDYINGGTQIDYCKGHSGTNTIEQCERGDTGTPITKQLTGTIRDFKIAHEDMEQGCSGPLCDGVELGIVKNTLGADNNPVFNQDTASTNGAANFNQWYNDVSGVNTAQPFTVTLRQSESDPNIYTFNSGNGFFPIDGQMLGNEGKPHNYHFTIELHSTFKYENGQMFKFTGDDDVWVFIDKKLVLDLGGVHPKTSKTVTSADLNVLGLSPGTTYQIDFFFAERQTVESNFRIDTSFGMN